MENNNSQNEYLAKKLARAVDAEKKELKRIIKKVLIWLIVLAAIAVVAWVIYKKVANTPKFPEVQGEYFKAQSREHILLGAAHPAYNSDPPTGGWHYGTPAQAGIYDKELADEQLIHNLEHGHIWLSYRPDLDPAVVDKLAEIVKSHGSKIIMTPRAKNTSPIVLVSWEYLLKLESFDEMQIEGFIKAHRDKGPEKLPAMGEPGFKDFRQK